MGQVIAENKKFRLERPYHSWDMNYHLINKEQEVDMLIDICSVYDDSDNLEEMEEYGGIHWEELKQLENAQDVGYMVWRVLDKYGDVIEVNTAEDIYKYLE